MKTSQPVGFISNLVFCSENVDPDFVTATLGLQPTFTQKVGESLRYSNGAEIPAPLGTWKLELLRPKASSLQQLVALDYAPYLDCRYRESDLSVCIDPELLKALGDLKVALSVAQFYPPRTGD